MLERIRLWSNVPVIILSVVAGEHEKVKLPQAGNFIISGDAMHFRENYEKDGVPAFNYDRSQTLASMDRLKKLAATFKATVIIQHDARDIEKLPAFPAGAK